MDLNNRIRERAYSIWQLNGCPDGRADDHWRAAEAEVRGLAQITPLNPDDVNLPVAEKHRAGAS